MGRLTGVFAGFLLGAAAAAVYADEAKLVLGWLEPIGLLPSQMHVKAKLDPGAKTSSIQARHIEQFDHEGETWVRFVFDDEDLETKQQRSLTLEAPLVREVQIKRHGAPNVSRPVVGLKFCLHNQIYRAEFSLADRSKFNYPVLLGRSFLSEVALVDSSRTFMSEPMCDEPDSVLTTSDRID